MSKFLNISAVLLLLWAISFTSCQKQNLQQNQVDEQTTLNKILNFKQIVENPTKNDDLISIDSAVWYIEALLNYNYCIVEDSNAVTYSTREDLLSIEISSDLIETNKVVEAYFEIEEKVLDLMNKGLKSNLVDVYVKNNKFYYLQVIEHQIEGKPAGGFTGFTQSENYYYAADIIEKAVNNQIKINTPYGYFTDIVTVEFIFPFEHQYLRNLNSNDPYYLYYYLFDRPTSEGNLDILSVEEMNFYYYSAFTAADLVQINENVDTDKCIKVVDLMPGSMPCNNCRIYHVGNFTFATYNVLVEPPSGS